MHTITLQMRWGDIDHYRHVNNVRYAQFLEDTRVQLMHRPIGEFAPDHPLADQSIWGLLRPNLAAFVARQEIEYREATEYTTSPIEVRTGFSSVGSSSFDFAFEVHVEGRLRVLAESTIVIVTEETGKPARLSPELRSVLEALPCEPVPFRRRRRGDK